MPTDKIPSRARTTAVLSALALLPAALTACGGSSKAATSPHASVSSNGGTTAATRTVAPATPAPAHTGTTGSSKKAASTAAPGAHPLAPAPRVSPAKARQAFVHVLTVFTDCLRRNGINMPKPNTSGRGLPLPSTKGINTRSAQYRAATAKCRPVVTAALRSSGIAPAAR